MEVFKIYLQLGFSHITDIQGYDHILFLITLSSIYILKDWKKVLILVTAFTIGHSVTLFLSTIDYVKVNSDLIEILIPVTILITSIANILYKKDVFSSKLHLIKYITAMFFGLIHGLGFSNYLKSLLGNEENIIKPLFAFNFGLEIGQIIIITIILGLSYLMINILNTKKREWNLVLSGSGLGISIVLILERSFFL